MKKYLISALLVGVPFLAYANANIIELNEDSTNHFPLRTYKETRISPFQTDETQAIACPAPFNLGNIQQRRDVYKAKDLDGNDQITGYGPWTETSRNCHRTVNQSQNLSCPANQRGTWIQVRNYTEYYNGSIINDSGWQTSSNTCAYYYVSTGYDSSSSSCPTGYTGSITSTRSYENWSDGSKRNYSGWYQSGYSCVAIPPSQVNFQILQSPSGTSYCSHKWRIRVTYPNGTLASGITLNWTANSPGTSLNSYSTVTNSNGEVENFVGSYNNGYITATVKWGASSQNLSGVCVGGT